MLDKMNLDHLRLLYCEFQKYEVMTMTVVGGWSKKHANPRCIKQQNISNALFSVFYSVLDSKFKLWQVAKIKIF